VNHEFEEICRTHFELFASACCHVQCGMGKLPAKPLKPLFAGIRPAGHPKRPKIVKFGVFCRKSLILMTLWRSETPKSHSGTIKSP
jgi:hypothetical protein